MLGTNWGLYAYATSADTGILGTYTGTLGTLAQVLTPDSEVRGTIYALKIVGNTLYVGW